MDVLPAELEKLDILAVDKSVAVVKVDTQVAVPVVATGLMVGM